MGENYYGITDPGRQRTNNEDSFIAQTVFNKHFIVASVIDGVGGYAGGEVAAQLTRDEIIKGLDKLSGNITDQMVSALENANERIIREKEVSPQNEKMACVVTLAVVNIEKNIFYYAHVGDTRLYLFRDGSLIKVTRDHSTVGFLEESGRLTEEAAMLHPKRNEVNKALGYETRIELTKDFIDTGDSPFLPGDTILICSDGLTDMIPAGKIISILTTENNLHAKGRLLVEAANAAGGNDNVTVVLVQNDKSPIRHEITKPLVVHKKSDHNGEGEPKGIGKDPGYATSVRKESNSKKTNNWLVLFCIILVLVVFWLLFKKPGINGGATEQVAVKSTNHRHRQELDFLDSINASHSRTIRLSSAQPAVITDTVLIKNDTLHIFGNGASFISDSAYKGPAFILSSSCKYILLDSMSIENFSIGILASQKGLYLRKVRFINCLTPLAFYPQLSKDTIITGTPAETFFYHPDSLHKKP